MLPTPLWRVIWRIRTLGFGITIKDGRGIAVKHEQTFVNPAQKFTSSISNCSILVCKHIIHGTISKDNKYKLLTWFRWPDVNWFLQEDRFWNSAEHIRWAWTSLFSRFADDFVVTFDLISVFYLVFLFLNCLKSFLLDFSFVSRQCFWAHRLIIIWMTWNCIKKK